MPAKTKKKSTKAKTKKAAAKPKTATKPGGSAGASAKNGKATGKKEERNFRKLSNVEHVRMRTGMWLGQNSKATMHQHFFINSRSGYTVEHDEIEIVPAVWKCLDEACMNAIDEYRRNQNDKKIKPRDKMNKLVITLGNDKKTISIEDNGRGIPAKNAKDVFLHLMYGENFDDMAQQDHVAGQNGVGISLVRMVSDHFDVKTVNSGQVYRKLFTTHPDFLKLVKSFRLGKEDEERVALYFDEHGNLDGCPVINDSQKARADKLMQKVRMLEQIKKVSSGGHGTFVEFRLNKQYFTNCPVEFDLKLLRQYLQDLAMTNPGLKVIFKHRSKEEVYQFKKGLEEIFLNSEMEYFKLKYTNPKAPSQIDLNAYIVIGQNRSLTWVNSNFASLGGSPVEYLENRLCDEIRKKPAIASLEKKLKTPATRNDVRNCFHMYIDLRLLHPRFKSQDKSYLINDLNAEIREAVDSNLDKLIRKTSIIDMVKSQMERRVNLKALENAEKNLRRARRENIPKLIPPTKQTGENILFIAEGDSAIAGLRPARDPKVHGLFPLRGKPLNVNGMTLAKAMANEEIKNIVAILGLPLDRKVKSLDELKYNKVSVITDADFDGYAIRSLVLSFFYEYWPELFDMGFINITTAPLYEVDVAKGNKKETHFCIDDAAYAKLENQAKRAGAEITRKKRNKGLGESSVPAMKYAVEHGMINITAKRKPAADKTQNLWFHKKMAEDRRRAISEYAGTIYDEN